MPVYEYEAIDSGGRSRKGILSADTEAGARNQLRSQGLYPSSMRETSARTRGRDGAAGTVSAARGPAARFREWTTRVSKSELSVATRQMATFLQAGFPLLEAVAFSLEQMKKSGLHRVLTEVHERVREGESFAQALTAHPAVFNPTYVTMVQAGESSGTLELVMLRLAEFAEQELALKRKIQSTLAYPLLMLAVGLFVIFFLVVYVIPRVTQIFTDLEAGLPLPTVILIAATDAARRWWWLVPLLLLAAWAALRRTAATARGRRRLDAWRLRLPLVGPIVHQVAMARFCRTLGTLLANGVPLPSALDIVRNVVDNAVIRDAVDKVRREVMEGAGLARSLAAREDVFPVAVTQMVSAGERSGELDAMLLKVADLGEERITTRLAVLTSLMEPLMILVLGSVVGFIVLAVLLPIFEMSGMVR